LAVEFPEEFDEICNVLRSFRFQESDILIGGGNESRIPKLFSDILRPMGWNEKNLDAELNVFEITALLYEGLEVMKAWGFTYKTNLIWYKIRKDGGPDRRGVGFYFRNVTELILFGVKGKNARTLQPGRTQENMIVKQKREHSRKPDE